MRVGLLASPPTARWPELDGAVPGWSAAGAGHVRGRDEQDQPAAQPTAEVLAGQAAHPRTATSPAARRCSSVRPVESVGAVNMTGWSLAALDRLRPVRGAPAYLVPPEQCGACRFGGLPGVGERCTTKLVADEGRMRTGRRTGMSCPGTPVQSPLEFNPSGSARGSIEPVRFLADGCGSSSWHGSWHEMQSYGRTRWRISRNA
jgi:hypothetical protein